MSDVTAIALSVALLVLMFWTTGAYVYWGEMRMQHRKAPGALNQLRISVIVIVVLVCVAVSACTDPINPVRYQPVEVLVTKPCFAGRNPPAEAVTLTQEQCTPNGQSCVRVCTDPRPEVCVTHAVADITELQREARQYRNLFKECSK